MITYNHYITNCDSYLGSNQSIDFIMNKSVANKVQPKASFHGFKELIKDFNEIEPADIRVRKNVVSKPKTSILNYLSIDNAKPVKLSFNSICSISVECIEMVENAADDNKKALLLTVQGKDLNQNLYLIDISSLVSKVFSEDHTESLAPTYDFESLFHSLSLREQAVLREVSLGNTSCEIASKMYISTNTVKNHRKNIKKKLGFDHNLDYSKFLKWSLDYFEKAPN